MNNKITRLLLVSFFYYFLVSSLTMVDSNPSYVIDPLNLPSALEDYEIVFSSISYEITDTLETYSATYVNPQECYPVTTGSPNCVSILSFSYNMHLEDSFVETQDKAYFEIIKSTIELSLSDQGYEEIGRAHV